MEQEEKREKLANLMVTMDFAEEMAIAIAEAIKDGKISLWDLRHLLGLYHPGRKAFSSIPGAANEVIELDWDDIKVIWGRLLDILRIFIKTLIS